MDESEHNQSTRRRAVRLVVIAGAGVAVLWLAIGQMVTAVVMSALFVLSAAGVAWLIGQLEDLTGRPFSVFRPPKLETLVGSSDFEGDSTGKYGGMGQRMRRSLQLRDDESAILEMIAGDVDCAVVVRAVSDMLAAQFPGSRFRFVNANAGRPTKVDRTWTVIERSDHDDAWVLQAVLADPDENPDPEVIALGQDLARLALDKARDRNSLQYQADHDSLTSLLSRRAILAELDRCVASTDSVGLIYGDVDYFKSINDRFGHLAGDHLLAEVARRTRVLIDESALQVAPGRLGGDEFLCVVAGCSEKELLQFTERLEFAMQAPMSIGTVTLSATMSWGVAMRPLDSDIDSAELLREADVALYQVKRNGRNALRLYDDELRAWTVERKRMGQDLATSINTRSGVHADFQPQYDQNLQLIGFEALGRWHRQGIGVVSPADFIPIAVEGGLMADFDAEIFRHVVQVLGSYRREGQAFGTVSINVSAERLERSDFVDSTLAMLRAASVDPRDVVLEITESSLLRDLSERGRRLEELQRWGLRIAIDDFGTGYSSLSYLRELPVDIVKLDKEFVADIETSSESRAIVEAIMALAQALDLTVVAEGVERRQQFEILHGFGCDIYQGFLFGRPLQRTQARDHAEAAWPVDTQMRGFEWAESPAGLSGLSSDAPAFSFSSAPLH